MISPFVWVKKGLAESVEQAEKVSQLYGMKRGGVIISELWCLLRYGAKPVDYVRFEFYKKNHHERNRYLTTYRYRRLLKKFGYYNETTYGKIAEYKTFSDYIHRPWIVADKNTDPQIVKNFIAQQGVVFAKPDHGDQGKGVMKIKASDTLSIDELLNDCKKDAFVVEGAIEQVPEIAAINPSSVNTVRAFTLLMKDGTTKILSVLLRVGKPGMHVDNWGSGGVCYNFDIESGVCDRAGVDKKNCQFVFHPGSNIQMTGFVLPDFEKLKLLIIELSHKVPEARYVGWDIAITSTGYELVEMNCPGGHDILQAFKIPFGDLLRKELK